MDASPLAVAIPRRSRRYRLAAGPFVTLRAEGEPAGATFGRTVGRKEPCWPIRSGPHLHFPRGEDVTIQTSAVSTSGRKLSLDDIVDVRAYERERDELRNHVTDLRARRPVGVGDLRP